MKTLMAPNKHKSITDVHAYLPQPHNGVKRRAAAYLRVKQDPQEGLTIEMTLDPPIRSRIDCDPGLFTHMLGAYLYRMAHLALEYGPIPEHLIELYMMGEVKVSKSPEAKPLICLDDPDPSEPDAPAETPV